ncbi:MAG TPA: DUF4936 domain-containing protein [Massilia sp.]|nr:DUF4936 domain-containing protein [Massilia sp.]
MFDLYVYYKVPEAQAAQLEPLVRAMQAGLAQDGIAGQLLRRPESKNGLQTWMEVYPRADERLAALVEGRAEASGMAALIDGPRRAEVFVEFTCA